MKSVFFCEQAILILGVESFFDLLELKKHLIYKKYEIGSIVCYYNSRPMFNWAFLKFTCSSTKTSRRSTWAPNWWTWTRARSSTTYNKGVITYFCILFKKSGFLTPPEPKFLFYEYFLTNSSRRTPTTSWWRTARSSTWTSTKWRAPRRKSTSSSKTSSRWGPTTSLSHISWSRSESSIPWTPERTKPSSREFLRQYFFNRYLLSVNLSCN